MENSHINLELTNYHHNANFSFTLNPNFTEIINFNQPSKTVNEPFLKDITAGKNSYVYDAHTYHTKVPPQGIKPLIEHYTNPGDVVLDPFCGSGMTGVAATELGRKVLLSDLSPAAAFIAYNINTPIDSGRYLNAVNTLLNRAAQLQKQLYTTRCRECGSETNVLYTVWSYGLICNHCQREFIFWDVGRDEKPSVKESKIKKEFNCPHCNALLKKRNLKRTQRYPVAIGYKCCGHRLKESCVPLDTFDYHLIDSIESSLIPENLWFPQNKIPVGVNTRQPISAGITTIDQCYTRRALYAMAFLWKEASNWPDKEIREKLLFTLTSLYQRVTVFSEFRFWGGSGNTANFNVPTIMNEQNVFQTFQRKAATISWYFRESAHIPRTVQVSTQSACSLSQLPNKSIDYVFTDPPFGANINYSEMNLIWESWLQQWTDNTEEAIVNSVQGKSYADYQNLLTKAFMEIKRVLKDKSWLTVAFHNSSEKVWMVIQKALADAGFEIKGTQIFDKKHGTFKMFVSDNAVGYDLILHCQKIDNVQFYPQNNIQIKQNNDQIVQQNIIKFIKKYLAQEKTFTKSFLHVARQPEFDYRRLYSKWLATAIKDSLISISFESFRELVDKIKLENTQMHRPRTLPAFTQKEYEDAQTYLAIKVAYMMGRKFEEGDWADVYCRAKGIPKAGWSNLNIDVMYDLLGVEHKMLCYRSKPDLRDACGTTLMHPAATRSIRIPVDDQDPNQVMRNVLTQYGELINQRRNKVSQQAQSSGIPDMRTGWLLWQESLRQFLYFEEEMLIPNPDDYYAEWRPSGGGSRKQSQNLWIYERETGKKRYSVTTSAGAKIQPYFDIPSPIDPNLYIFTVIGEVLNTGLIRVWLTESTKRELQRLVGSLDTTIVSETILRVIDQLGEITSSDTDDFEIGYPILLTQDAYAALQDKLPGVNDDHCFRLLTQYLRHKND
ncbi:DNA methyltransferase [Nostoc piscinale]|uniref:DNA methyltransferase n=1 Tax=Nostoc piscinale TaxID=224012 RepID=UPI0039A6DAB8